MTAKQYFESAMFRLREARALWRTPRGPSGAPLRVPRHIYMEEVQRGLAVVKQGRGGGGAELPGPLASLAPLWWRHGGLAEELAAGGEADAALAHRLCASTLLAAEASGAGLLGVGSAADEDDDEDGGARERAEFADGATDEARCAAWLDIADDLERRGDHETAAIYRDRAFRLAKSGGLDPSSPMRRRAFKSLQPQSGLAQPVGWRGLKRYADAEGQISVD